MGGGEDFEKKMKMYESALQMCLHGHPLSFVRDIVDGAKKRNSIQDLVVSWNQADDSDKPSIIDSLKSKIDENPS